MRLASVRCWASTSASIFLSVSFSNLRSSVNADAHQLLKAAHPLLEAFITAVHASVGAVHAGIEPIHAGIGGRLAFCHRLQDGFNLIEFSSNIGFHIQLSLARPVRHKSQSRSSAAIWPAFSPLVGSARPVLHKWPAPCGLLPGIGYIAARLQIVSLGILAFRVIYVASTLQ